MPAWELFGNCEAWWSLAGNRTIIGNGFGHITLFQSNAHQAMTSSGSIMCRREEVIAGGDPEAEDEGIGTGTAATIALGVILFIVIVAVVVLIVMAKLVFTGGATTNQHRSETFIKNNRAVIFLFLTLIELIHYRISPFQMNHFGSSGRSGSKSSWRKALMCV
jgi:hypothetical protein